jgi:hypothetical protein
MFESSTVPVISRIGLKGKSGPTCDIMVHRQPPPPRPNWVRAYTVVTFWSSWSISLRDTEPHIYHNSVKIVPRATLRTLVCPSLRQQLSRGPYAVPRYTPVTNVAAYTIRTFSMKTWISFTALSRNLEARTIPLDLLFHAMQNAL